MRRNYHTIERQGKANARKLAEFLSKNGQLLLPVVDLIELCRMACDELIDVTERTAIQAVLELSAQQAAGGLGSRASSEPGRWSGTVGSPAG